MPSGDKRRNERVAEKRTGKKDEEEERRVIEKKGRVCMGVGVGSIQ